MSRHVETAILGVNTVQEALANMDDEVTKILAGG